MKRIALAIATLALVTSARAEDGHALFSAKCASCHGPDGKGQTKMGEKLGVKDLTKSTLSEADLEKTIETGKPPKMTAYKGKLSDAEIKAVAEYVKGLAK
jgi:cbb3-type cytochrome c oxidase subunit III